MISSIKCPKCNRIFIFSFHSRRCVCGWEVGQDKIDNVKERVQMGKNKKKKRIFGGKTQTVGKSNTVTSPAKTIKNWEVEVETVTSCDKAPKDAKVFVELLAKSKIDMLMNEYKDIEWFAYLVGERPDETTFIVKDILVPFQDITATKVDNIECPEFNKVPVIGAMHSHHGMGNGFSGHDHEFVNGNHDLSLCISSRNGIAGQIRWTTPCGAVKIISNIKVKVKYPDIDYDFNSWIKESKDRIKKKQATYTTYTNYPDSYGWGFPERNPMFPQSRTPLNQSQKSYCVGSSVKEARVESKTNNKESEPDKDHKVWSSGIEKDKEINSPQDEEQSLEDALTEMEEREFGKLDESNYL